LSKEFKKKEQLVGKVRRISRTKAGKGKETKNKNNGSSIRPLLS
jgi:hypothetical protein